MIDLNDAEQQLDKKYKFEVHEEFKRWELCDNFYLIFNRKTEEVFLKEDNKIKKYDKFTMSGIALGNVLINC